MRLVHLRDDSKLSKLVNKMAERFNDENKMHYAPSDYIKAKRLYIYFMLGTYNPRRPRNWEDYYDDRRRKTRGRSNTDFS